MVSLQSDEEIEQLRKRTKGASDEEKYAILCELRASIKAFEEKQEVSAQSQSCPVQAASSI